MGRRAYDDGRQIVTVSVGVVDEDAFVDADCQDVVLIDIVGVAMANGRDVYLSDGDRHGRCVRRGKSVAGQISE